ncbi:MAG: 2-succinyl-6-hydroxy-2,4-cyclohexadiene-1-carboxylate synthase [Stenomitos rutilans HA7619-LM2]|nr:2-succinyl-6-hydroxy-2,4-cyclohexadiene-1-carboxylate synthase [Stenomitos rutilans HA7619-LM2]
MYGRRDRPTILFLHGFMGNHADFDTAIAHLASHFCCITVDLPGHGQTIVEGDAELYTLPQTAKAIVTWLDQLQISHCFLVGYSMGGRLALYLALHFPQRFPKVVLESASPGLKTDAERTARLEHDRSLADQLEADFPSFLSHWYSQPLFQALRHQPAFDQLQARRSQNNPLELAKALRFFSTGLQPSLWEWLPHHTQSLLLLVGASDRKFCATNQAMANDCPMAQLRIVPMCGHVIHLEQPHAFATSVQAFLQ